MNILCKVSGIHLDFKNTQSVVSGGRNQYDIEFEFTDEWHGFIHYAIFSNLNFEVVKKAIIGNLCSIPSEFLQEKGEFQFGVYGVSEEKSYSSKIYNINVNEGVLISTDIAEFETASEWEDYILRVESHVNQTASNLEQSIIQTELVNEKAEFVNNKASEVSISTENAKVYEQFALNAAGDCQLIKIQTNTDRQKCEQALSDLLSMLGTDVATLVGGKIPVTQIPSIATTEVYFTDNEEDMLMIQPDNGDICIRTDEHRSYIYQGGWKYLMSPTDYSERAGSALTAENALNSNMINNKRIVSMTSDQYANAVKDENTFYFVTSDINIQNIQLTKEEYEAIQNKNENVIYYVSGVN